MSRSSPHADALNDDNAPGFASVPIYRRLITFDGWLIPFSVLVSFIPAQDRKDKKKFIHGTSETRKGSEFTEILPSDFSNPKSDSNARNKTFLSSLMMLSPPPLRLSLFNDIKLFVVVSFVFLFFPLLSGLSATWARRERKHFYGTWGDDVLYGSSCTIYWYNLLRKSIRIIVW